MRIAAPKSNGWKNMKVIKKILRVEDRGAYKKTYAIIEDELGNLEEAVAFGDGFENGQEIEYFFDDKWGQIKFQTKKGENNARD